MNPSSNNISMLKSAGGAAAGVPAAHRYALKGKITISAVVLLFAVVLVILFLHFYVRWHVLRRARRLRRLLFSGEIHAPSANQALDAAILNSLPVLLFSVESGDEVDLDDCAVCLNEFGEGEKIRCLPRCGHRFHVDCIDMWFMSHASCPICRAAVEAGFSGEDAIPAPDLCSSCQQTEATNSSSSDLSTRDVVIEIPAGVIGVLSGEAGPLGLGLGLGFVREQVVKWTSSRVLLIWGFLTRGIWTNRVHGSESGQI